VGFFVLQRKVFRVAYRTLPSRVALGCTRWPTVSARGALSAVNLGSR
jgi:hypothetical protein